MRWFLFSITLILGAVLGVLYGWVVKPVQQVGTTPASLRSDYQADFVLMVAEAYQVDGDLVQVVRRLAPLGEIPPEEHVRQAILIGSQIGYSPTDIDLLEVLASDLRDWDPASVGEVQ
jgi:hypothetical protein